MKKATFIIFSSAAWVGFECPHCTVGMMGSGAGDDMALTETREIVGERTLTMSRVPLRNDVRVPCVLTE